MSPTDKDIEKLIVRRLDGALSEGEELALDRALIRDPQARRLMEDYQRIDNLTSAALQDALGGAGSTFDTDALPDRFGSAAPRTGYWLRTLVPGAVAAALLAMVIVWFSQSPVPSPESTFTDARRLGPIPTVVREPDYSSANGQVMRNATDTFQPSSRPRLKRSTGREVFGVVGENGNIYWIEVERTRTIRRPKGRTRNNM